MEGFKRKSKKESANFYTISEGSLEEVKYQVLLARDLDYIPSETYKEIEEKTNEVGKMLYSFKKVSTS